jgi:Reverse transcriptase (RNA-dependent DNA polymerase)
MVIRSNEQQAGIDYFETFASVLRYTTLRILLAKAVAEDLEADHIDIDTAFLNPDLIEEVYMRVLEFMTKVYPELAKILDAFLKLNKSLYRLKQAPRA